MGSTVIKGTSYSIIHAADLMLSQGITQQTERAASPDSVYLRKLSQGIRSYQDVVNYAPNQAFIGNLNPDQLREIPQPWHINSPPALAHGVYGEIMSEDMFFALLKIVDVFDLVQLEESFAFQMAQRIAAHPLLSSHGSVLQGDPEQEIQAYITQAGAEALTWQGRLVGCVRRAHEFDPNLNAHTILENLTAKASGFLALKQLLANTGIEAEEIDFIIEASEEACGDMNQRGGGNFAKAIGEIAGCRKASGCDVRGFCAAPAHALVVAAGLVQSGIYKNVVIVAGGSAAKLGMNGKSHVEKGIPALEDVLGAFALLVGPDDGKNPIIRTDCLGRHRIGSGSSPQAVLQALVSGPLAEAGLKFTDVDKYSVEMQNPEITVPAGAGDVPGANYKMIGAMAVKQGEFGLEALGDFILKHGMPGFAPTQGHIPSGIPFIGHARDQILAGRITRAMIVGKGSLFLARMTNLFDGVSFIMEKNPGRESKPLSSVDLTRIVLTTIGGELGVEELVRGAELAKAQNPDLDVILVGPPVATNLEQIEANCEAEAHRIMEALLADGQALAAVTMHYNFPLGVATVGRITTPARGKPVLLATTTGSADAQRVAAMVYNTLGGIAVAKTLGIARPKVGILNIEGARQVERILTALKAEGYPLDFAESFRTEGGSLLRGNDLLSASADVVVCDSLTGNLLMKLLSGYTNGGTCEVQGWGYGPGVGQGFAKVINIISRASGAPVVAGAITYALSCVRGSLGSHVAQEYRLAQAAGLDKLLLPGDKSLQRRRAGAPSRKPVTVAINGLDILELEEAIDLLWESGIYAESGMGCTGPVVMLAPDDEEPARAKLLEEGLLTN